MQHTRAHIAFKNANEATEFVCKLNTDGTAIKYALENFDGSYRVDARSILGVIYMMTEYNQEVYLVDMTTGGELPNFIDKYRVF